MELVEIQNQKGKLVRNTKSMALLNIDKSAISKDALYKAKKERDAHLESEINNIKSDIKDIRLLLQELMNTIAKAAGN